MDKEYAEKLQRFRRIVTEIPKEDRLWEGPYDNIAFWFEAQYLLENNSFENTMDRVSAEKLIEHEQRGSLDINGGYPLWDEVSFRVNGEEYTVIAYGVSNENEGKDALFDMVFIREDEESRKLREWGSFRPERDFVRFNKYLYEVKKGLREPNGKDEFGIVPYICERCGKEAATIISSKRHLCAKCDNTL
ncbi:MAG: hypothetical protein WED05_07500 [Candidatus Atabeyarchaeum deiterrae]